jgi:hypothetical protein
MSRAELSLGNTGSAHYRGNIIEPVLSSSQARKPLHELDSLGNCIGLGSSFGSLEWEIRVKSSTRVA